MAAAWTADEVAALCYGHYGARLPRRGKPEPGREWTLMAAVLKVERGGGERGLLPPSRGGGASPEGPPRGAVAVAGRRRAASSPASRGAGLGTHRPPSLPADAASVPAGKEVVAMGTGTKCLGRAEMRSAGKRSSSPALGAAARGAIRRGGPAGSAESPFCQSPFPTVPLGSPRAVGGGKGPPSSPPPPVQRPAASVSGVAIGPIALLLSVALQEMFSMTVMLRWWPRGASRGE